MTFLSESRRLEAVIRRTKKEIAKLERQKSKAATLLCKGEEAFKKASVRMARTRDRGTQIHKRLSEIILSWDAWEIMLVKNLFEANQALEKKEAEFAGLQDELENLKRQNQVRMQKIDRVVEQAFELDGLIVSALDVRSKILKKFVVDELFSGDGKLPITIPLNHSTGRKRIVIKVQSGSGVHDLTFSASFQTRTSKKSRFSSVKH